MSKMITFRLPDRHLGALDACVARGEVKSRAAAMALAIEAWLRDTERRRIDTAMVASYRREPQRDDDLWAAHAERSARAIVADEPW